MTTIPLTLDALAFGYGRVKVGGPLTMELHPGETLALLGPNGSGKTTLFKTVLGLLPPLGGRVLAGGTDTTRWSPAERARLFGYVPQSSPGFFPFSVAEVVLMGRTARIGTFAAPSAKDRAIAARMLDRLGIAHLAGRDFPRISGGERQLVLIARALTQEPAILVLDEPTASLDFGNQRLILETIRHLSDQGLSIILSTHHPDEAFAIADKAALLRAGQLLGAGSVAETLTAPALSALYGVPVTLHRLGDRMVCL